jgi:lipopolysaccharide export system permease protein
VRILTRYVLRQLVAPFLFAATALTALMLLDVVAKRFGALVGKGLGWRIVAEVFLYSIPYIVAVIVPMAVLVAVLFAFNRLAGDNEISAMKASGVSLARITAPVVVVGALVALGMVRFNDAILPETNHHLSLLLQSIGRKSPTFYVQEREVKAVAPRQLYLLAQKKEQTRNVLIDVTIWDRRDPEALRVIYADSAEMGLATGEDAEDLYLTMYDGVVHEYSADSPDRFQQAYFREDYLVVPGVENTLDREGNASRTDRELSIDSMWARVAQKDELVARASELSRGAAVAFTSTMLGGLADDSIPPDSGEAFVEGWNQGRRLGTAQAAATTFRTQATSSGIWTQEAKRYEVEIWKKYSIPAACIVFVLIGAPIAVRYRRAGVALVVGVSLVVFCAYYVALIGGENLADREIISPFWAMWAPNVLFLVIGIGAFLQARRAGG